MSARRVLCVSLAAALCGCAGLSSTLPAATAPVSFVGFPGPAVPAAGLEAELQRTQDELQRRLAGREWSVPLQLARAADGSLHIRLGADESFEPVSAELAPAALLVYAEIGEAVKAAPMMVTHILVHGDVPAAEAESDLTARRAAAVQSYLASRGVPGTRLRAEGRGALEPATPDAGAGAVNRRVELVLKPVVEGREAAAWVPPQPSIHD